MENELTLPSNLIAEKAVISLILIDPDRFVGISDYLYSSDFYELPHQDIWKAMVSLYKCGQDIDIVSIKTELKRQEIDPNPAMTALVECYEQPPVIAGNLMKLAQEVKNRSLLRQIIGASNQNSQEAKLDGADAKVILSKMEKDIVNISEKMRDDRPSDASGILDEIRVDMIKGQEMGWRGFNTGFKWLDTQTGGLIPTHCWIVGSYTGGGKTFFLLQIVLNVLAQGGKVMLFSTEMDRKMNMLRLLGNLAGLGTIKMLKGEISDEEKEMMSEAEKKLSSYGHNLIIYDNVYTTEEIRLKAKKKKLKEGLDMVAVDFIQNLRGDSDIYNRMSNAAIALQQTAQELQVSMVIASQVTQAAAGWESREAIEYKGAGEIAAIADVGIWIRKVQDDKNAREVILRKVRHGIPGSFLVRLSFPSGRVIDMEDEESIEEGGGIVIE